MKSMPLDPLTGMPIQKIPKQQQFVAATFSTYIECEHANGWYFTIHGWFIDKMYLWCDDCCKPIFRKWKFN